LNNAALLDAVFPPGQQWAEAMRDIVAATDVEELGGPQELIQLLRDYLTKPEIPAEPAFVRIMSLHASKGLTSRVVIVAGIIESLIPRAVRDEETPQERMRYLHEQRRLFYVAVTRASERLVLSSPAYIDTADALAMGARVANDGRTSPSRFIAELGLPGVALRGTDWREAGYRAPG
jgi:superfamily I DNA/RNA helicase